MAVRFVRVIARVIACGTLLILQSCQIPTLQNAEQAPALPTGFNGVTSATPGQPPGFNEGNSSDNSAQLGVAEFFNDGALTDLIQQGMHGNLELKGLDQEVEIASNDIRARQGAYLPFASFGLRAGVDKPSLYTPAGAVDKNVPFLPGQGFPEPRPDFGLGLNFLWQLDIWRELRNARDAAAQRYAAACEKRNFYVTQLVAEIGEKYYKLMALDKRMETLDVTIKLQENSLQMAKSRKEAGRDTELAVKRFEAEVHKNQSEKLIVKQEIVETENRINFLLNRYPQPVDRTRTGFFDLSIHALSLGLPAQLLQNRPDIRQAERELAAAGLDVQVARAHFFPRLDLSAGVGYAAFNPKYLFITPESLIYNAAGELVGPLINKKAIQAEYCNANARQLKSVYNYQRVTLNAFTEVVNRVSMVENYSKSIEIKKLQLQALVDSVKSATSLFQAARVEYIDVLFSQRDLMEARMVLIETKNQQLSAVVNAYQALGGGTTWSGALPSDGHVIEELPQQPSTTGIPAKKGIKLARGVEPLHGRSGHSEKEPIPLPVAIRKPGES